MPGLSKIIEMLGKGAADETVHSVGHMAAHSVGHGAHANHGVHMLMRTSQIETMIIG